ncbi:MAG: DUF4157 domain-containing protein [Alphaproteobacteria bacterium]
MQRKPAIGAATDPLEREADRIAEQIVRGDGIAATAPPAAPTIQRKCAACAAEDETVRRQEEEDDDIRLKPSEGCPSCGGDAQAGAAQATRALSAGGTPLAPGLRAYFEPRLGHDLSDVRLHVDGATGASARRIHARAYTLGSDIGFAPGAYAPESTAGRRLIAHELGHVVQQRAGAPPALRRAGEEGTTEFRERVIAQPSQVGSVWRGRVERTEVVPATDTEPETQVHQAVVGVSFDESTCTVGVKKRVRFQQANTSGTPGICDDSPPLTEAVDSLPNDEFEQIKSDYIEAVNDGLSGWYAARLEGAACAAPCMEGDLTIDAGLIDDSANPDLTINVVNRAGRGDAGTICAREGLDRGFAIHEGGHQVLGTGDEYAEPDPAVCRRVPEWCRRERIRRTDWSRMGSHRSYGRFALFHERHFQFVPAFLRAVYPDCTARLVELSRPVLPDFRANLSLGFASLGGQPSFLASAGVGLGIPLDRLREAELTLGVQGTAMLAGQPDYRQAFLIGFRAGIERRVTPSAGGFTGGAFLEAGAGYFSSSTPGRPGSDESWAPYVQGGLGLGYTFAPDSVLQPYLGAEITAGTAFPTTGIIGEPGATDAGDENWRRWFGVGAVLGGRF